MSDVMVHLSSKVYYGMLDDAKKQGAVEELERILKEMKQERWNKIYIEDIEKRLGELK